MRLRRFLLVLAFSCSACSGSSSGGDAPDTPPALLDVWSGYEAAFGTLTAQDIPCADTFGTWFEEFGVRGVACVGAEAVSPMTVVQRAGATPFLAGPHRATAETFALDLTSDRDFGHYNPAFVRWIAANGIVGEGRPTVQALTQPLYDRHLRRLARIYWLTYADLEADGFPRASPAGMLSDYAAFLDGGPVPEGAEAYESVDGFSVFAFTELSEALLPRIGLTLGNEWEAKYEANTAFGFWLRRRADGTLALWHDGLRRLLTTYDADWLAEQPS